MKRTQEKIQLIFSLLLPSSARVVSLIGALGTFFLLNRYLGIQDFVVAQTAIALGYLGAWLLDFGTTSKIVMDLANGKKTREITIWMNKLLVLILGICLFCSISLMSGRERFFTLFFVAGVLDNYTDLLSTVGQVIFKPKTNVVIQTSKRVAQIILLLIVFSIEWIPQDFASVSITLPSIVVLTFYSTKFKPVFHWDQFGFKTSVNFWILSGAYTLANLDVAIVGEHMDSYLVRDLVLSKRFVAILGIISGPLAIFFLQDSFGKKKLRNSLNKKHAFLVLLLCMLGVFGIVFGEELARKLFQINLSASGQMIMRFQFLAALIGSLNSVMILKVISLELWKTALLSSYVSIAIYLIVVGFSSSTGNISLLAVAPIISSVFLSILLMTKMYRKGLL